MKSFNVKALVIAIGVAFSVGAMAEKMSKTEYQAEKDAIFAEYKVARSACSSLSGNANDICEVDAKGRDKVAKAELEANYKPSIKHSYAVSIAKAEATYAMSREKCDDMSGNPKDVCVQEAKAAEASAKADAKAQMKISDANVTANMKTADARMKAREVSSEARKDAKMDKADASYSLAKEKRHLCGGGQG